MDKIVKVIVCPADPNKEPYISEIEDELEPLQEAVGGYLEQITLYGIEDGKYIVLCDEDGRLKRKPLNCLICGYALVGDILICRQKNGKLIDVPERFLKTFLKYHWTDLRQAV